MTHYLNKSTIETVFNAGTYLTYDNNNKPSNPQIYKTKSGTAMVDNLTYYNTNQSSRSDSP
jgi:hypothetical protein